MDETDFRILQAMGFQPYTPELPPADAVRPSRLARRVGLGVKATKDRIARMESAGVIAGYSAYPNLRHFPLQWRSFHFRVPEERKAAFVKAIEPLDGVTGCFQFLGRDVCVDLFFQDDAERDRRLRALSGAAGSSPWEFYDNYRPPAKRPLSPLDWRIVKALRHDAKKPLSAVAKELRVTPRTVRNRFERMIADGSLWIVPNVDFSKIAGFVAFGLLVYLRPDPPNAAKAARSAIEPSLIHAWVPPSKELGSFVYFLRARTTGDVDSIAARVRALAGVERVELLIPAARTMSLSWLDEAIDRRAVGEISVSGASTDKKGNSEGEATVGAPSGARQAKKR
ncbi:MAG: Lrp/AsnC family transcriptional regulator [Euryarchaeota archaeon]|nr:Lrp/AsnC family transcriptional regulator [Euryarchaeota archaeon]